MARGAHLGLNEVITNLVDSVRLRIKNAPERRATHDGP
jgi:hypothetical protein